MHPAPPFFFHVTNFSPPAVYFMSDDDPDATFVARCIHGDLEAFGPLVERYQRQIFRAILHMVGNYEDTRELTQQVFLKAFEHLSSFDQERKFFSWLYRIAMNESINHLKSRRSFEPIDEIDLPRDTRFDAVEKTRSVRQAVMALKPEYRSVVVLRHFMDCSYSDAAAVLNLPEKTVKSRLFAARQLLRDALAPVGEKRTAARW